MTEEAEVMNPFKRWGHPSSRLEMMKRYISDEEYQTAKAQLRSDGSVPSGQPMQVFDDIIRQAQQNAATSDSLRAINARLPRGC
jgi:hypothetical protein